MIRDALRIYGRHFRVFLLTSCLLYLPIELIEQVQKAIAGRQGWSRFSTAAEVVITLADFFAFSVTCAALTMLAADLQTGGHWGWREAWSRALVRARPIITSYLAFFVVAIGLMFPAMIIMFAFFRGVSSDTPTRCAIYGTVVLLSPLGSLIDPVAVLEGRGGFGALRRSRKLLKNSFRWKAMVTLTMASTPALFASLAFGALLPGRATIARLLAIAVIALSNPLNVLVSLAVYRKARAEQSGYTDDELRSSLDLS